ncbi:amino acid ABC transporter substrate-binding protein [Azospirillum sp. RWY-5-1]|uniref:Amino acid ABC transporter substrate-binding protein n=1 Tax=Azospirillum oleiclasticum TaxID=2735135 RepID=A0ABX2T8B7_9PROT|nr:amino acid ABC transporter substrate-binding protein [Azospirillum oleiclasticum]NYZ13406.1 amino acid ABC transporter substrate-binding protein [Azospirillum oleiclasticum]NYZ20567.1 amino acid ABC transporter substrate-binding protein [Azospirillum oleiclasticum]
MRSGWLLWVVTLAAVLSGPVVSASAAFGDTLERVRERGVLRCGVTTSGVGLAVMDEGGHWKGFFVDLCRAVAAAATGGADNVEYVELSSQNRFKTVEDGSVDVSMEGTTWTLERDMTRPVDFPIIYMYDGQGFMAHRSRGIRSLADIADATVCVIERTTSIRNLEAWQAETGTRLTIRRVQSTEGALSAFFNHHCDLYTNDRIGLFAQRLLNAPNPADYVILPEVISKEPLGPMVRAGDDRWRELVRWVILATIVAEEKGLTEAKAPMVKDSPDPEVGRLLGLTPGIGTGLGLDDRWALRVISAVGNFGEIFDRNLGAGSRLGIDRGQNALWNRGGLMYAPPLGG